MHLLVSGVVFPLGLEKNTPTTTKNSTGYPIETDRERIIIKKRENRTNSDREELRCPDRTPLFDIVGEQRKKNPSFFKKKFVSDLSFAGAVIISCVTSGRIWSPHSTSERDFILSFNRAALKTNIFELRKTTKKKKAESSAPRSTIILDYYYYIRSVRK